MTGVLSGSFQSSSGGSGGTVTAVTGVAPIASTGGATPAISIGLASNAVFGAVKVDGTTIASTAGVISTIAQPQPYDLTCSLPGKPGPSAIVMLFTFTRNVAFAANFGGSAGTVGTDPTGTATYTVNKNGSSIGTVVVSTLGVVTFTTTGGATESFVSGDRMTIVAPSSQDATLSDAAFTISGTR
jgi:hypothetical protein